MDCQTQSHQFYNTLLKILSNFNLYQNSPQKNHMKKTFFILLKIVFNEYGINKSPWGSVFKNNRMFSYKTLVFKKILILKK